MGKFQPGNPGGPGRPKRADKFAGQVAKAEKRIADRLPVLIDKMFELADGVTVQTIDDDGVSVYTRPPDRGALTYLIDRIMGKPTEHKEIDHHIDVSQLSDDELQSLVKT
jgi:hypothetical protein